MRVIDLRHNRFTRSLIEDKTLDFVKSLQRNESLTNIDMRNNSGFDKTLKFKMSLIMLRNIDKLRSSGVMVQGPWLNRDILMVDEAIQASKQKDGDRPEVTDYGSMKSPGKLDPNLEDSIFNIELNDLNITKNMLDSSAYQEASAKPRSKSAARKRNAANDSNTQLVPNKNKASDVKLKFAPPRSKSATKRRPSSASRTTKPSMTRTNSQFGSTKKPMSMAGKRRPLRPKRSQIIGTEVNNSLSRSPGKDLDINDQTEELTNFSKLEGDYVSCNEPRVEAWLNQNNITKTAQIKRIRAPTPPKPKELLNLPPAAGNDPIKFKQLQEFCRDLHSQNQNLSE